MASCPARVSLWKTSARWPRWKIPPCAQQCGHKPSCAQLGDRIGAESLAFGGPTVVVDVAQERCRHLGP
eukprot:6520725-Pyramimonas_sp.AAC.1